MPVIAMWKCDRDGSMFDSKKEADAYDKLLELGEQFTALLENQIEGIDEAKAEDFGLLLAKNKELIIQACKGRPEVLGEIINPSSNTVTPIGTATGS
ncbi:MAG: hypothetical protein C9356_04460 [Oleiphilus sp.]|nr:MAG: hypothetical protein C9356_04460 [Oleiphilus sp.]